MAKKSFTTYLVPGFHSDVVWLEDQRDYAASLMGALRQNLQVCRFDPAYGVFVHELTYLKPYLDISPEDRTFMQELIAEGRVGTGGSHGQPMEPLISGEGIVRNILYGRLYHERVLGDHPTIYMPWDVFGHTAQLPQILAKSRFTGCIWSKNIQGAHPVFWQQALDGSRLLFRRVMYGLPTRGEEATLVFLREAYEEMRSLGFPSDLRLDAIDFKPPTPWMAGACERLLKGNPSIVASGRAHEIWFEQAQALLASGEATAPTLARDFEWHHQGTGLSRVNLKQANRLAENALQTAETFSTFAALLGADYPDKALDKAWRQVLFGQHHDGMAGPLCDRAYVDLMLGYREALELAAEARDGALDALARAAATNAAPSGSTPILVFNALNWERTEPVQATVAFTKPPISFQLTDDKGKRVPFEVSRTEESNGRITEAEIEFIAKGVPPFGYATYAVVPCEEPLPTRAKAAGFRIQNKHFRVTADPEQGGGISSLYDKLARRELLNKDAGPGNELVALEEKPNRNEPAWELYTMGPKSFSRDHAATVSAEEGPISTRLIVHGEMSERRLETSFSRRHEIILYKDIPRIYCRTWLEHYRGEHHLYAVTFPSRLRGCQPVFETRFGAVLKRPSKGKLDFRTSQASNYSDCGARRCHNWIELGRSAVLKVGASRVALGMVNLVTTADPELIEPARRIQTMLVKKGVPVTPQRDDCDMARRRSLPHEDACLPMPNGFDYDLKFGMSFRICLDVGGANTYVAGLLERLGARRRQSFDSALERNGHAALFLYDDRMPDGWPPLPVLVFSADSAAALSIAINKSFAKFDATATIEVDPRADTSTKRRPLDDYGLALLNRGNVLGSVENDGSLVLFLMHTAAWGGTPWGKDRLPFHLVPEHKSHVFHYALYPHRGDWRSAQVWRAGAEYNNPLIARQAARHRGSLPARHSFLKLDGDSLVVSAVKPVGNPTAALESKPHDILKDGILVRWYEAAGQATPGKLSVPGSLESASWTNLLEEPQADAALSRGALAFTTAPFSIETAAILPQKPKKRPLKGALAREVEPVPAVHFRHWEHNAGAAPLGYSPVGVTLRGDVKTHVPIRQGGVTVNTVELCVVNNYTDRDVKGAVALHVGEGWHTVPEQVPYDVPAGGHQVTPVLLVFDSDRRDGYLEARLEHGGQTIQDVLAVGEPPWLTARLEREGDALEVHLDNAGADALGGVVSVASPLESWPEACVGDYSLGAIEPREQAFAAAPGETASLSFRIRVRDEGAYSRYDSIWAVVKIACNGRVEYLPVQGSSIRT
ncbi:hypothetical protein HQ560_14600 [bacterium]|nr:hypothetical protein [bacterium]